MPKRNEVLFSYQGNVILCREKTCGNCAFLKPIGPYRRPYCQAFGYNIKKVGLGYYRTWCCFDAERAAKEAADAPKS